MRPSKKKLDILDQFVVTTLHRFLIEINVFSPKSKQCAQNLKKKYNILRVPIGGGGEHEGDTHLKIHFFSIS